MNLSHWAESVQDPSHDSDGQQSAVYVWVSHSAICFKGHKTAFYDRAALERQEASWNIWKTLVVSHSLYINRYLENWSIFNHVLTYSCNTGVHRPTKTIFFSLSQHWAHFKASMRHWTIALGKFLYIPFFVPQVKQEILKNCYSQNDKRTTSRRWLKRPILGTLIEKQAAVLYSVAATWTTWAPY